MSLLHIQLSKKLKIYIRYRGERASLTDTSTQEFKLSVSLYQNSWKPQLVVPMFSSTLVALNGIKHFNEEPCFTAY